MTTQEHQQWTDPQVSDQPTRPMAPPVDPQNQPQGHQQYPPQGQEQYQDQGQRRYEDQQRYQDQSAAPAAPLDATPSEPEVAPTREADEVLVESPQQQRETSTEETLFAEADLEDLRGRWSAVQAGFVDDPRECVQKADVLVSDLVEQLTNNFAQARSRLEDQWSRGEEASTEDLRMALMHYREFFQRLLAV